jgi:hypothetical protein
MARNSVVGLGMYFWSQRDDLKALGLYLNTRRPLFAGVSLSLIIIARTRTRVFYDPGTHEKDQSSPALSACRIASRRV